MREPMQSEERMFHTRSEFLGIYPTSHTLKRAQEVFGQKIDHGAKDIFRL